MTKWDLFQVCKTGSTFKNQSVTYINMVMLKNHMIISNDAEKKMFDKVQYPFTIKTLCKLGSEGSYFNLIKSIYQKKPQLTSYLW